MSIIRSFDKLLERWERSTAIVRLLTFPAIVILCIPYNAAVIPLGIYRILFTRVKPPVVKDLSRAELSEWANRVVARFEPLVAMNPHAADDLEQLCQAAKRMAYLLNDPSTEPSAACEFAVETIKKYSRWRGLLSSELVWLAKHVENWATISPSVVSL